MSTAVIIARFQTPYLHQGHIDLIEKVQAKHHKLIIVLGIPPVTGTRRNPYDYHTREQMIKAKYKHLIILPLSDQISDENWSKALDNLLQSTFPTEQFRLYGSRDSFIAYYSGQYETEELPEHGDYNATELRQSMSDKVSDSQDFRAGILYAYYNQYTKVYPTVDIVVFRNNGTEVLLGKKSTNYKWRFVGGFIDPEDDSYETAAVRELREECGDIVVDDVQYESSARIDDWRYRKEADKIITTLYSAQYVSGTPKAKDDIVDVGWIAMKDLPAMLSKGEVTPEHVLLFDRLIKKYVKG